MSTRRIIDYTEQKKWVASKVNEKISALQYTYVINNDNNIKNVPQACPNIIIILAALTTG